MNSRPEEIIRQALVHKMIKELGYPASLISIEKSLHSLPHLSLLERKKIPNRRLDILVFAKNIHPDYALFPLLMIECKAETVSAKAIEQVIGYNDVVKAPFLAVASQERIVTGYYHQGKFQFIEGLYTFDTLLVLKK